MNNFSKHFLAISVIATSLLVACGERNNQNNNSQQTDSSSAMDESKQFSGSTFQLADGDTIRLEAPLAEVYDGTFNDKPIRVIHIHRMDTERMGYADYFYAYVDGQEESFQNKNFEIRNEGLYLRGNLLKKSSLKIKAYDGLAYQPKESALNPLAHNYDYRFSFVPADNPLYAKVFNNSDFKRITLGENHTETLDLKHAINLEPLRGLSEEEACYSIGYVQTAEPSYVDSVLFNVLQFSYTYLGGAHGVYSTNYSCFRVSDGKRLELSDIISTDDELFAEFFEQKLSEFIKSENDYELSEGAHEWNSFYILPSGICFVYPMYSLGGGAWEKHFNLSFEELAPFLRQKLYD